MYTVERTSPQSSHFSLGVAVDLARYSPYHRRWKVASVERLVIAAIDIGHFIVYEDNARPVGFVTYAFLSHQVENKLLNREGAMLPEDWKSGEQPWVIDVLAPFGHGPAIVKELRVHQFPNDIVRSIRRHEDGSIRRVNNWRGINVREIPPHFTGQR